MGSSWKLGVLAAFFLGAVTGAAVAEPCHGSIGIAKAGAAHFAIDGDKPLRVGEQTSLSIRACASGKAPLLSFDAVMPAHGHGLNYRPELTETEPGRWRVEGLLFHMAGRWEFRLRTVEATGVVEQVIK